MKKLVALLLAASIVVTGVVGCNTEQPKPKTPPANPAKDKDAPAKDAAPPPVKDSKMP